MGRKSQVAILAVALLMTAIYSTVSRGLSYADEAWFLQVLDRVAAGEVLYRDVFFGATPLSLYLVLPLVKLFGSELLVVKAAAAGCFVGTMLLSWRILRQLDVVSRVPWLLMLALLHFAPPSRSNGGSLYSPIAILWLLACLSATVSWSMRSGEAGRDSQGPAWAGAMAGLCFASKQNLGLYTLAALLLSLWLDHGSKDRSMRATGRQTSMVLVTFTFTVAIILVPVWWSGGGLQFLQYGFLNKGNYLQTWQGNAYWMWLVRVLGERWPEGVLAQFYQVETYIVYLLPLATVGALGWAWLRAEEQRRSRIMTVLAFVVAAFLVVFPLGNLFQLTGAIPVLIVGLGYAWTLLPYGQGRRWGRMAVLGATVWLVLAVSVDLGIPMAELSKGELVPSALPHFRGVAIPPDLERKLQADAAVLAEATQGVPTFILRKDAALYYLVAGIKNPTPFDYPLTSALGRIGERGILAGITEARIRHVCLVMSLEATAYPQMLIRWVLEHMEALAVTPICIIYQLPRS